MKSLGFAALNEASIKAVVREKFLGQLEPVLDEEQSANLKGADCHENVFRFSLAFQKTWGNIYFQSPSATPTHAESMRARNIAPAHRPGLGTETKRL